MLLKNENNQQVRN